MILVEIISAISCSIRIIMNIV